MTASNMEAFTAEQERWKALFYTPQEAAKNSRVRGQVPSLNRELDVLQGQALEDKTYSPEAVATYLHNLASIPAEQVDEEFWGLFNENFRARIDRLVEGAPRLINEHTKYAVIVAAMNETELETMYQALKSNHSDPEKFEEEVAVVCYHNYIGERAALDPSVQAAMGSFAQHSNVALLEESVTQADHSVSVAKVIASCAALRLKPADLEVPLLLADADIEGFSQQGMVEEAAARAGIEQGDWLISSNIDYTSRIGDYPALQDYFTVRSELARNGSYRWPSDMIPMVFMMMNSKLYQMIGGYRPTKDVPENRLIAEDLRSIYPKSGSPVKVMGESRVVLFPDRELVATAKSGLPEIRYLPPYAYKNRHLFKEEYDAIGIDVDFLPQQADYKASSGALREGRVLTTDTRAQIPLLTSEHSNTDMVIALNTLYLEYKMLQHNIGVYLDQRNLPTTRRVNLGVLQWLKRQGCDSASLSVFTDIDAARPLERELNDKLDHLTTENVELDLSAWDGVSDILGGKVVKIFHSVQ